MTKSETKTKEERLAEALRANLRRRKGDTANTAFDKKSGLPNGQANR